MYKRQPLHWRAIRDTYDCLVRHGDGHKKLWLNEYGWNTTDEARKAHNLRKVLHRLAKPEYHMVFQASYLVITDLPGDSDIVNSAYELGCGPKERKAKMTVGEGGTVTEGQVIAKSSSFFGLCKREVCAPSDGTVETISEMLAKANLAKRRGIPVKILAKGEISKPLTVQAHAFSGKAREAIEAAGGTCVVIES